MATFLQITKPVYIAVLISAAYAPSLHAQSMISLGTLGGIVSFANGVSADGSVIVGYSYSAGNATYRAFKYNGTAMIDLGTLGGTNSKAYGVSADGSVVVGESDIAGNAAPHAFKYTGNTMADLGTLGGTNSVATGVSSDGSVIVGYSLNAGDAAYRAFKYTGTAMADMGTLGGTYSSAYGVSADGKVIVGFSGTAGDAANHAFKYIGTVMTDLGTLGGTVSYANGVSADGSVIVGRSSTAGNAAVHAFKYTGTTMTNLGTLGGTHSEAYGVSADGKVIVGDSNIAGNAATHAFKYTGTTMADLGTLGGTESQAFGVSADGSVIVGVSNIAGDTAAHAFVYGAVANGRLVDVQNTYTALATNGYQLNSLLNAQNTLLGLSLNSDCTVYGANNICVSAGGRNTNISGSETSQTAGNLQLGFRVNPSMRLGVFLDKSFSNIAPSNYTVNNSQPLTGLFAVYAPTGTNLGPQVKFSSAYSSNGVNISRTTLANTEGGQGASSLTTQGTQLEAAYGFEANDKWTVAPFGGVKATKVTRSGYTETFGATFPITFDSVEQSATTAFAGVRVSGYVTPEITVVASAGVEHDLSQRLDDYTGSIYYLGAFALTAPTVKTNRAAAAVNASYWIEKDKRLSVGIYYTQQSLNTANGMAVMLNYTVGL